MKFGSVPVGELWWILGCGVLGTLVIVWFWRVVDWVYWKPNQLERALRGQGLRGTPYRLLTGDLLDEFRLSKEAQSQPLDPFSHSIVPRVLPFLHDVMNKHGKLSFSWFGTMPRISITDPELAKEVLSNKVGHLIKQKMNPNIEFLISGLVRYEGEKWAKHRRIINPAFHLERLKNMLPELSLCCNELIRGWERFVASEGSCELNIWPELQNLTGDVISRAAFSSSYEQGRRIFQLQVEQTQILIQSMKYMVIPGYRFLPTPNNIKSRRIHREVRTILEKLIEKRKRSLRMGEINNDLLGQLMESNSKQSEEIGDSKKSGMTVQELVEECKLLYIAGQDTTASLLTWTMILLSMHPSWQLRAREEISQVFGKNKPDFNGLNHLKIVTMILYEIFRLYPPFILLYRQTQKTMKLGGVTLPSGALLTLPIISIHHDPNLWGEDVDQFKPERFADGVPKASRNQMSLLHFGWGPRICIGQNFAMLEAKMVLSRILQHFSFELSPSYIHAPRNLLTLQPQHGAQVILHKL